MQSIRSSSKMGFICSLDVDYLRLATLLDPNTVIIALDISLWGGGERKRQLLGSIFCCGNHILHVEQASLLSTDTLSEVNLL